MDSTRTYGEIWNSGDSWRLRLEPHVAMWAKRIFKKIPKAGEGTFKLTNTPEVCRDLEWFMQRFPLRFEGTGSDELLRHGAKSHREHIATLDQIIDPNYKPRGFQLAVPARDYQLRAAELYLARRNLLLADDVGLGKTCAAICSFTECRTLPAVVVCLAHLPKQWLREINRFAPDLFVHVVKHSDPYELPKFMGRSPDVLLISYYKLHGWSDVLGKYCNSVVFDECQELRRSGSDKFQACVHLAENLRYRLGTSATPIYNYGGEIFNVLRVLNPDCLGTSEEFFREWCTGRADKARLRDPAAFGSWLKEQHIMLRRTRHDVNLELPPLSRVTHEIDSDLKALKEITGRAGELARLILAEEKLDRGAKMQAAEEFSMIMRQATGIAKAPYVASFVDMLLQNGEPVVLYGWHRAVYEIWLEKLAEHKPAMYTGSESPTQKQSEVDRFMKGQTDLLMVSLRSGAGVDGLQQRCRTTVHGELDWSAGVLEQNIGRVFRAGQPDPVTSYFLISDSGSDPLMAEVLGLKREQLEGIRNDSTGDCLQEVDTGQTIRRLAEQYVRAH